MPTIGAGGEGRGSSRRRSALPRDARRRAAASSAGLALAAVEGGEGVGADALACARLDPGGDARRRRSRSACDSTASSASVLRPALEPRPGRGATATSARRGSSSAASRSESSSPCCRAARPPCEGSSASKNGLDFGRRHRRRRTRSTTLPSRKAFTAGIPCTPKRPPTAPGWRRRRPWPAAPCRRGSPRPLPGPGSALRQGPHHSAQKSTTTGVCSESSTTSRSKVASVDGDGHGRQISQAATPGRRACPLCRRHGGVTSDLRAGSNRGGEMSNVDTARSAYEAFGPRRPGRPAGVVRRGRRLGHLGRAAARRRDQGPRRDHRRTSPRSPTTGRRSASSRRSSSTPASRSSCAAPSAPATTRAASRPRSCTC